jgi:outer membrane immunogenic protein
MCCHVRFHLTRRFFRFAVCVFLVLSSRLAHGQTPFNWSGFYIGGNAGWNWAHYDAGNSADTITAIIDGNPPGTFTLPVSGFERSDSAFIGGGQLGYNFQFGVFVLGLEGDFDERSSNGGTSIFSLRRGEPDLVERSFESNWSASGRLRAGVTWRQFLFYATGGGAFTDLGMHVFDGEGGPAPGAVPVSSSSEKIVAGWVGGVGAEYAITKAISVGLEYRHAGFGNESFTPPAGTAPILGSFPVGSNHFSFHSTSVSPTDNQITFRANFLFNGLLGH